MKRFINLFLLAVILPAFVFTGCKKDDEKGTFTTLTSYMLSNNMDLPQILVEWIITPDAVVDTNDFTIPGYHVFDIRKPEDFATGQ